MLAALHSYLSPEQKALGWFIGSLFLGGLGYLFARYNNWVGKPKADGTKRKDWLRVVCWTSIVWVPVMIIAIALLKASGVEEGAGDITEESVHLNTKNSAKRAVSSTGIGFPKMSDEEFVRRTENIGPKTKIASNDDWTITTISLPNGGERILKINKRTGESFSLVSGKWSRIAEETLESVQMRRIGRAIGKEKDRIKDVMSRHANYLSNKIMSNHNVNGSLPPLEEWSDDELEEYVAWCDLEERVKSMLRQSDCDILQMVRKNTKRDMSYATIEKLTDDELDSIVRGALSIEIK